MSSLDYIRVRFDQSVALASDKFSHNLEDLTKSLIVQVSAVPADPSTANDVFSRAPTEFDAGIGDGKTGIYGTFVTELTAALDIASQAINKEVSFFVGGVDDITRLQSEITALTDHLTSVSSASTVKANSLLTSSNDRFVSAFKIAQAKACTFFIRSLTDSFLASIARSRDKVSTDLDRLLSIYNAYQMLPSDFYTDVNTILTEIATSYNDSIDSASSIYSTALGAYKYFTSDAQAAVDDSQSKINAAIADSNAFVTARLTSLPSQLYNKADYVFSVATVDLSNKLFKESSKLDSTLNKFTNRLSDRIDIARTSVRRYISNSYVPVYQDGVKYRNAKATVYNGVSKIISDLSTQLQNDFNSETSLLGTNYNTALTILQQSVIDYINENVPGLTQEQVDDIQSRVSSTINRNIDRSTDIFAKYSNQISSYLSGLSSFANYMLDSRYSARPLIRFEGTVSSPSLITNKKWDTSDEDNVDVNRFRFKVSNVGGSPWVGWFGIKFVDTVVEDSDGNAIVPVYWLYNKHSGFTTILPGQVVTIDLVVPVYTIPYSSDMVNPVSTTILVNTYGGMFK
jgi:hypothetical protein